jgi:uridylate kinase
MTAYTRILLKLSGESLMGEQQFGIDPQRLNDYAEQITHARRAGVEVAIVIGGGNIFRGMSGAAQGFDRVKGDQMGMLATVINSLALQSALKALGTRCRVFTAIRMEPVGELYAKDKVVDALKSGEVCIVAGGTGNPYFTTDTASALRGIELEADAMFKGTRVDGIYTADPEKNPDAVKFDTISFSEIFRRELKIMDLTATTLCKENNLKVVVFNMDQKGNLMRVLNSEKIGTIVYNE